MDMLKYTLDDNNNATEQCMVMWDRRRRIAMIGSWACARCVHCAYIDSNEQVVSCTYPDIAAVEEIDKKVEQFDLKEECRKIANLLDPDCPDSGAYIDGDISLFELVKRHVLDD